MFLNLNDYIIVILIIGLPVLLCAACCFFSKKRFWLSPVISTVIVSVMAMIELPSMLTAGGEATALFWAGVAGYLAYGWIVAGIAYLIAFIAKKRRTKSLSKKSQKS